MSVYLNVKDEVAQNKLHHKIPNLLGFFFPISRSRICQIHTAWEKDIWCRVVISKKPFSGHPVILGIFLVFFMTSLCRDIPIETIKMFNIEYFFLMQPCLELFCFRRYKK